MAGSNAVSGTDGLIPLGCMPSGRFGSSIGGGSISLTTTAAAAVASPRIPRAARRQLLETRQQQLEASVAGQLNLYARHSLLPVDKVKEARKKMMQESQAEVEAVSQQLQQLGLALPRDVISHALLPLADTPYMNCMAKLPRPGHSRSTSAGGTVLHSK
eukprot:gene9408-9572_t